MPSAPGRLSMITGCPSDCDIEAAMTRAMTSVAPPVPNATIARSGLVGYWACARDGAESITARHAPARILFFISALDLFLPRCPSYSNNGIAARSQHEAHVLQRCGVVLIARFFRRKRGRDCAHP